MFPPDQLGNHSFLRGAHFHEEMSLYDSFMMTIYMVGIVGSIIMLSISNDRKDE